MLAKRIIPCLDVTAGRVVKMLTGVNTAATAELARAVSVPVIASGGMHTLDDVRALLAVEKDGVTGAVLGRSLYEGTIDFAEALKVVEAAQK